MEIYRFYKIEITSFFSCLLACFALACTAEYSDNNSAKEIEEIATIIRRINSPNIPPTEFNLLDFGSKSELEENIKPILNSVIQKCSSTGGGKIIIPPGNYVSKGPIHLLSNIHLHLQEGANIIFSLHPKDYLPNVFVRWEGVECYNYSPFIYAINQKNIRISGNGLFNGNAYGGFQTWHALQKPSQSLLREMGRNQVPIKQRIFGEGFYLRPSFMQLVNCQNIEISDINIINIPFWGIHPTYCKNVTIKNVRINSRFINNDGFDIDSSEDVLIENCSFTTGDDAIAIKSGRDQDGWRVAKPSRNIVIRNCVSDSTLHGLAIGSEMSGGVENVFIHDFDFNYVDAYGIQFKSNRDRGGYIRDVLIRDIKIQVAKTPIFFTNDYHGYSGGNTPSSIENISISEFHTVIAKDRSIDMIGTPEVPIRDVFLKKIKIEQANKENKIKNVKNIHFDDVSINGRKSEF